MYFKREFDETGNYKTEIHVHKHDAWDACSLFSVVINAVLKELRQQLNDDLGSTPFIEECDVPPHLLEVYNAREGYEKGFCLEVWDWILGEIIWATDEEQDDILTREDSERWVNAMRLFGKYYGGFWN